MMRAMLGRRPAATDDRITSSDAPSNISMRMCESEAEVAPSTTVAGGGSGGSGGWRAGPRATIGAATDSTIVVDRIAALIRPPRRPRCASPRPRKITAEAVTSAAPTNIRSRVIGSSTSPNPRRLSHISAAAAPAAIVHSHDSSRTLNQPGDSTSTARICRITISA